MGRIRLSCNAAIDYSEIFAQKGQMPPRIRGQRKESFSQPQQSTLGATELPVHYECGSSTRRRYELRPAKAAINLAAHFDPPIFVFRNYLLLLGET